MAEWKGWLRALLFSLCSSYGTPPEASLPSSWRLSLRQSKPAERQPFDYCELCSDREVSASIKTAEQIFCFPALSMRLFLSQQFTMQSVAHFLLATVRLGEREAEGFIMTLQFMRLDLELTIILNV